MAALREIRKKYHARIAPLDLELLFSLTLGKSREYVLAHPELPVSKRQQASLRKNIGRREKGEPLAYILGQKEFYGLEFKVNRHTLIPRPETELLVDLASQALRTLQHDKRGTISIFDIGTGSGNIVIALAHDLRKIRNNFRFTGIDISSGALRVARFNSIRHKLGAKIDFLCGDLLGPVADRLSETPDDSRSVILANLPYLDTGWKNLLESSETRGLKYEPARALYAGRDGLSAYRRLAKQLKRLTPKNALLLCEIGPCQKKALQKIFSFARRTAFHRDLAGKWRVAEIQL